MTDMFKCGHEKIEANIVMKKKYKTEKYYPSCGQCVRDRRRAKWSCDHDEATYRSPNSGCRACVSERRKEVLAEKSLDAPGPDGWEDEYGPVPPRVPSFKWYDEVMVLRVLHGGAPVPRKLTTPEKRAIVKRGGQLDYSQIAERSGETQQNVSQWFKRYGRDGS